MNDQARARARQLAQEFAQRRDATGWFERLYTQAQGNEQAIYWAQMVSNPNLVQWLDRRNVGGKGRRALVIGCGLGDDAEELAHRGFEVVACIAGLLAKEGTLLVICRGRSAEEHPGNMPWPLTTEELDVFKSAGLRQVQFEDYLDQEEPPVRRFRVEYQRAFSAES